MFLRPFPLGPIVRAREVCFDCRRAPTSRSLRYVGAVSVSESAGRAPVQVLVLSNHLSSIVVDRQIGSIVVPDKYRPSIALPAAVKVAFRHTGKE
jgi:hypothetical protein